MISILQYLIVLFYVSGFVWYRGALNAVIVAVIIQMIGFTKEGVFLMKMLVAIKIETTATWSSGCFFYVLYPCDLNWGEKERFIAYVEQKVTQNGKSITNNITLGETYGSNLDEAFERVGVERVRDANDWYEHQDCFR